MCVQRPVPSAAPQQEHYLLLKQTYLSMKDQQPPVPDPAKAKAKRAMLSYLLDCMKTTARAGSPAEVYRESTRTNARLLPARTKDMADSQEAIHLT